MRPADSTILLVDDNPQDVLRLIYAFAHAGHAGLIDSAENYPDAVARLEGSGFYANRSLFPVPGLLVVDLDFDRGLGFQLLERVTSSNDFRGLRSVVLTSSRHPQDVQRSYALGAHDYRVKPALMVDLCAIVHDIEAEWIGVQADA